MLRFGLGFFLLMFFANLAWGQVYRCVDAQGEVVFSDSPAADFTDCQEITVSAPAPQSAPPPPPPRRSLSPPVIPAEQPTAEQQQKDRTAVLTERVEQLLGAYRQAAQVRLRTRDSRVRRDVSNQMHDLQLKNQKLLKEVQDARINWRDRERLEQQLAEIPAPSE